jgi:hypothetical protein
VSAYAVAKNMIEVRGSRVLGEEGLPNTELLNLVLASGVRLHQFVGA